MEVLLRDTLEWEKIDIKGKQYTDPIKLPGDITVTFLNCLAVRGKVSTKGLGYCSRCGKIMTKKEHENHKIAYASPKKCAGCYYLRERNAKLVTVKGGNMKKKCDLYCGLNNCDLTKGVECKSSSCNGEFKKLEDINANVYIPNKILTAAKFVNYWELVRVDKTFARFKHPTLNLTADIDKNGYLKFFTYKNTKCYFDGERLRGAYGLTVSKSQAIVRALRRLYL